MSALRQRGSRLLAVLAVVVLAARPVWAQDAPATPAVREMPPPPGPPRTVHFPRPAEQTLPNGLRVLVVARPGTGLVSARLLVRTGGEADPAEKAGLADMTATLLTRGTMTRGAPQIAETIEALGGSIEAGARWDASTISVTVLAGSAAPALVLLADVVRHPAFREGEIERLRTQTLDDLAVSLRNPGTLARWASARAVWGDAPYGHPLGGTPESLRKIRRDDLVRFHQTYYRPDNGLLVIGGDIGAGAAWALARRVFGDWRRPDAPLPPAIAVSPPATIDRPRLLVIDKPDAGQAAVVVAEPGIRRTDPDYTPGRVADSILGGGFSSRLNQEIRVRRGLSYGAGSRLDARRQGGAFTASAQCKNASAAEVAALLGEQIARLASEDVSAAELTPRKAALTGPYARSLETTGGLVAQTADLALHDLSLDEINRFLPRVEAVTPGEIRAFASAHLSGDGADVVIVGDARQFREDLRRRFAGADIVTIPVARLDFNRADLTRP